MMLSREFIDVPLAHRGLHDSSCGRPENSRSAVLAAMGSGYGIEVDVQVSRDGEAFVFHDQDLSRLTGRAGLIGKASAESLVETRLLNSSETIPRLSDILDLVAGRVPVLIEIKDVDEMFNPIDGRLESVVCDQARRYPGPVALMSFHPESVARCASLAPDVPRGLVTGSFCSEDWPGVFEHRLAELRSLSSLDNTGASFVSHEWQDLESGNLGPARHQGIDILCWTVRSPDEEAVARRDAANITFEGYLPEILRNGSKRIDRMDLRNSSREGPG